MCGDPALSRRCQTGVPQLLSCVVLQCTGTSPHAKIISVRQTVITGCLFRPAAPSPLLYTCVYVRLMCERGRELCLFRSDFASLLFLGALQKVVSFSLTFFKIIKKSVLLVTSAFAVLF